MKINAESEIETDVDPNSRYFVNWIDSKRFFSFDGSFVVMLELKAISKIF